jgi:hypothetical protein
MAHLPAVDEDADRPFVVLVVGLRTELGLTHQLVAFVTLAAADGVESVLVVALTNDLDDLAPRQKKRL